MDYFDASGERCCMDLVGSFMMLPRRENVQNRMPPTMAIDDGIFNHPVIIVSNSRRPDFVKVLVVTSFDQTPIHIRHARPQIRRRYLPIYPAAHPDTEDILTIAHGKMLRKRSYVNTSNVHRLPLSILWRYQGDAHLHLEGESYRTLVRAIEKEGLLKHSIEPLSTYGMKPPLVQHHQHHQHHQSAAGCIPAIGSTVDQNNMPHSLLISAAYGTFPASRRSDPADLHVLPRFTVAPSSTDRRLNRPIKKYAIIAITAVITAAFIICILAACWYASGLIWSVVQASVAIGRDVYNWLMVIASTIGGAIARWLDVLKNSFGGSSTAM